jgi:hypothetical protein
MFNPWGAGAFGSPKEPATRKWRRKPLVSQETDSKMAAPEAVGGGARRNPPRQLSDVVKAKACSSPPIRPFNAS